MQNLESLSTETWIDGGILWYYGESNAVPPVDVGRRIQFHEVVPDNFANAGNKPCIIILDDLLNEAYSKEVCHLFTKGSHHRNISVLLRTQNLFQQAKHCRDVSLNAKYIVLLKNTRDKNHFTHLARQVYPEGSAGLYRAILRGPTSRKVTSCRLLAGYGRPAAVSNQHISRLGATCILYSID